MNDNNDLPPLNTTHVLYLAYFLSGLSMLINLYILFK